MWRKERPGVGLWGWTRKGDSGNGLWGAKRRIGKGKKRETGAKGQGEKYQHANVQRRHFN